MSSEKYSLKALNKRLDLNIQFLINLDPSLSSLLNVNRKSLEFCLDDEHIRVKYEGSILFDSLESVLVDIQENYGISRQIASVRVNHASNHPFDFHDLDSCIIDKHDSSYLDRLPCLSVEKNNNEQKNKDFLFIGALQSLLFVEKFLENELIYPLSDSHAVNVADIYSIVIVEASIPQLLLYLSLIDISVFVAKLKKLKVQFSIAYADNENSIKERLFNLYTQNLTTALLGLRVFTFPFMDDKLRVIESWLFSQSGLGLCVLGSLGSFADELNQVAQHLVNTSQNHYLLRPLTDPSQRKLNCIVTGSGPSLDENLIHIQQLHDEGSVLIAGGSSVRTLLLNNIVPDILVLLERGSEVYEAIAELSRDFAELSEIILISSSTLDPRVSSYFNKVVYYHRPLSSSLVFNYNDEIAALPIAGPESANAALEVAGALAFKKIALFGIDFGTVDKTYARSRDAYDHTPRDYDVPQRGNMGRTVYSQDSLISAKSSAEVAIRFYSSCKFLRYGEGLVLNGVEEIQTIDKLRESIGDLSKQTSCDVHSHLMKHFLTYQHPVKGDVSFLVSNLNENLSTLASYLVDPSLLIKLPESEIYSLHPETHAFFVANLNLQSQECLYARMFRQPVFYMLSTIYDSSNIDFFAKKSLFYSSMQLLILYTYSFLKRQKASLENSQDVNVWSPTSFVNY